MRWVLRSNLGFKLEIPFEDLRQGIGCVGLVFGGLSIVSGTMLLIPPSVRNVAC